MRACLLFVAWIWLGAGGRIQAADWESALENLDQTLSFSALEDRARLRVSGTLELELYHFSQPSPGLIDSNADTLFSPRLTLFLDAQLGSHVYLFAQARVDRGFDPSEVGLRVGLEEYALRYVPWNDGRFNLQVGQFSTVVGHWVARHLAWDNPFIDAPFPYANVTAVSDIEVPESARKFATERFTSGNKYEYNPIVWGPSYTTGLSAAGRLDRFDYAFELKNAALAARPGFWELNEQGFSHPALGGRLGFRPNEAWNLGFSASRGTYLRVDEAQLPGLGGRSRFSESVCAQDASFEWHHWQLWAEIFEARFEVPRVGDAGTVAYFLETKYKFTPQLFGALRWNQQFFGKVDVGDEKLPWGPDAWRIDSALGYRFTPHSQIKLQASFGDHYSGSARSGFMLAAQFTLRF